MLRLAGLVLSVLAALAGLALVADHQFGTTGPEVAAGTTVPTAAAPRASRPPTDPSGAPTDPSATPDQPGVPVRLEIPFPSSNHAGGVTAAVSADPLQGDGTLFVPADPQAVSWASDDAAPGAAQGTSILTGHVNYVVDGRLVQGALSDLAQYAVTDVGKTFTVVLADGRRLAYRITGGVQYDKTELAARPELRAAVFDQTSSFGDGSGRVVLVSCGGAFDHRTGNYEDNVFVFAVPVTTAP